MGSISGNIQGSPLLLGNPQSLGCTLDTNEYPSGGVTFESIGPGVAYWKQGSGCGPGAHTWALYLCDESGGNAVNIGTVSITGSSSYYGSNSSAKTFSAGSATGLAGKALYLKAVSETGDTGNVFGLQGKTDVTINTALNKHTITCVAGTGGTLKASASSAAPGTRITMTATPKTGYKLKKLTSSVASVTISKNKFTMPNSDITITATFEKAAYKITTVCDPAAGGTLIVTVGGQAAAAANKGDKVDYGVITNTGYVHIGYRWSAMVEWGTGDSFYMPASNLTVTALFRKISSGTLSKTNITGGETITLTISPGAKTYTHKYKLSWGTGMETSKVNVAKGVKTVNIAVPLNWSAQIPNQTSKTGGTLLLESYEDGNLVGSQTITGLVYNVPTTVKPTLGTITTSIIRTVNGKTYASLGDFYVQSHTAVRIQASASGAQGSTIQSLKATISGYSGGSYNKTVLTGSLDFTSGWLSRAGNTTITITATDSRGRSVSTTRTIEVKAYAKPSGTLKLTRVDVNRDPDDMGQYGTYVLTKKYTALGSNTFSWTLSYSGGSASSPANSGDLLPGSRKTFDVTQEYPFTLTLQDSLETVNIITNLPTARYILAFDASGNRIGVMRFPDTSRQIPAGKLRTFEVAENVQIYIGNMTLEDYIRSIVNN